MNHANVPAPALAKLRSLSDSDHDRCRAWIETLPPTARLEPGPVYGTNGVGGLAGVRRRIASLEAERAEVDAAPSLAELTESVRAHVAEAARRGAPIEILRDGRVDPKWSPDADAFAIACWIFPEKVIAKLVGEIERSGVTKWQRMRPGERRQHIAGINTRLTELRYVEEALVSAALERGEAVERSSEAPPAAVLGVRVA